MAIFNGHMAVLTDSLTAVLLVLDWVHVVLCHFFSKF